MYALIFHILRPLLRSVLGAAFPHACVVSACPLLYIAGIMLQCVGHGRAVPRGEQLIHLESDKIHNFMAVMILFRPIRMNITTNHKLTHFFFENSEWMLLRV